MTKREVIDMILTTGPLLISAVIGVIVGWGLSLLQERMRERREAAAKSRRIAGLLAAELSVLRDRGRQLLQGLPVNGSGQVYVPVSQPVFWSAEEQYFTAYNSLGADVVLLPGDLSRRVVEIYGRAKVVVDTMRAAAQ